MDEQAAVEYTNRQQKRFEKNSETVGVILEVLRDGFTGKTELIAEVMNRSGIGRDRIRRVLNEHNGPNTDQYQYWIFQRGDKNCHTYFLNPDAGNPGV